MNYSEIITKVKENGFCKADNFLNNKDLLTVENILRKRIFNKKLTKDKSETFFYRRKNKFFFVKKLLKLELSSIIEYIKLIRIAKKLELNDIADKIFNKKSNLVSIDSYFSPKSDEPVLD